MAIILEAAYSKKLGLPNYSRHSYVVSIRTDIADLAQVEAKSARSCARLQQSVDNEIQQVGFLPDATRYGMHVPTHHPHKHQPNRRATGTGSDSSGPCPWRCSQQATTVPVRPMPPQQ